MRLVVLLLLCSIATLSAFNGPGQNKYASYGIVPLHSNRSDVERQFGQATDPCRCIYRTAKETITVDYAASPCKGKFYGWNVPKDTVLGFRISPNVPSPASEVDFNSDRFIPTHSQDENITNYFTDVLAGIKYAVQENRIISIYRLPSTKDSILRCRGFPAYDGGVADYITYDSFTTVDDERTIARLDNFAVQLLQGASLKGYVIAYAGKTAKRNEGTNMARWASRYLIQRRGIPSRKVIALDGGFREEPQYDLFLLPLDVLPPTPTPHISSDEIRMIVGKHN